MTQLLLALGILLSSASSFAQGLPRNQPVLECTENCRRFNNEGTCEYRSECRFDGDCVSFKTCGSFDFFGGCSDERVTKTCAVPACPGYPIPSPQFPITCESRCQKRDAFGKCIYTTGCEIQGRCMTQTDCEKFDTFGEKCLSERLVRSCY